MCGGYFTFRARRGADFFNTSAPCSVTADCRIIYLPHHTHNHTTDLVRTGGLVATVSQAKLALLSSFASYELSGLRRRLSPATMCGVLRLHVDAEAMQSAPGTFFPKSKSCAGSRLFENISKASTHSALLGKSGLIVCHTENNWGRLFFFFFQQSFQLLFGSDDGASAVLREVKVDQQKGMGLPQQEGGFGAFEISVELLQAFVSSTGCGTTHG